MQTERIRRLFGYTDGSSWSTSYILEVNHAFLHCISTAVVLREDAWLRYDRLSMAIELEQATRPKPINVRTEVTSAPDRSVRHVREALVVVSRVGGLHGICCSRMGRSADRTGTTRLERHMSSCQVYDDNRQLARVELSTRCADGPWERKSAVGRGRA